MTQLRNRLSLDDDLAALHARSERYERPYAVAMCDIDDFKAYNDSLGHRAGDDALLAVATALAAQVRQGDVVDRYGEEEFLVVLPEQDPVTGTIAAERLRAAVEALGLAHPESASNLVTVSIGVAAFQPEDPRSSDDLVRDADRYLYRAKAAGRNRVAAAGLMTGAVVPAP